MGDYKFNVTFTELEHMDIEEAKKIVAEFNNEDIFEELGAEINGEDYCIYPIDESDWDDQGKYQCQDVTGILCKSDKDGRTHKYDIAVTQSITRSGSYFSEYYYEYDPLEVRQLVQKVIPQQIIPEHTIVTFAE